MPKFSVTRKVPFTVDQVFAISSDVAQYRQFLPLVRRSVVRNKSLLPDGREAFEAELTVAYKKLGIEETLHSNVTIDKANRLVLAQSTQGPVKHLDAVWKIIETGPDSCEIEFTVDYALKSRTLQFVLSGMFDMMVRKVLSSFEERARFLYGSSDAKASA
jgi:coenzyme Q-binding protein COQ10